MSLHNWQTALLKMLPDPQAAEQILAHESKHLTCDELDGLTRMSKSLGLAVTRDAQSWWRQARLQIAIPFSMRLIEQLKLHQLLEQYQKQPCITLFFLREAQTFCDFIHDNIQAPTILRDLVRFECTLHMTRLQELHTTCSGAQSDDITELFLSYCPADCLSALLNNTPLPHPQPGGVRIQFNRAWPRLWRTV